MLDVDFEFFDPQPIDYHSVKLLLSQLLSHDAPLLDLGAVTNIVLDQKLVGSTVKTDGAGGDPYAILTILNLNVHKVRPLNTSWLALRWVPRRRSTAEGSGNLRNREH